MREQSQQGGIVLRAVASTNAVLLSWNVEDQGGLNDVLGFTIQRTQPQSGQSFFLRTLKSFSGDVIQSPDDLHEDEKPKCTQVSPIQGFSWSDYSAQPDTEYVYTLFAIKGSPGNLVEGNSVSVQIRTESSTKGKHSVLFNRGVAGSQGYTRKFCQKTPEEVEDRAAYRWS